MRVIALSNRQFGQHLGLLAEMYRLRRRVVKDPGSRHKFDPTIRATAFPPIRTQRACLARAAVLRATIRRNRRAMDFVTPNIGDENE